MRILPIGNIDGNGQQYIWVHLEEEKVNERDLWSGFKTCSIELNHKKQISTVNEFYYSNGVPQFIRTVKVYKNEIISESEVERVLKECGLIKGRYNDKRQMDKYPLHRTGAKGYNGTGKVE